MEPFIILLVSFAILGILDIIGLERINIKYILFFALAFVAIFLYNINLNISGFIASLGTIGLVEMFGSIIILVLFPGIGIGDKIFLATTFLIYPFWLMWTIILLALILTRPIFRLISVFVKDQTLSVPFYPFLFLSSGVIYALVYILLQGHLMLI